MVDEDEVHFGDVFLAVPVGKMMMFVAFDGEEDMYGKSWTGVPLPNSVTGDWLAAGRIGFRANDGTFWMKVEDAS